jgi:hypothetical protein
LWLNFSGNPSAGILELIKLRLEIFLKALSQRPPRLVELLLAYLLARLGDL